VKTEFFIGCPELVSYETWLTLTTTAENMNTRFISFEDGYYSLSCEEESDDSGYISGDIRISRELLAGPLLEAIEDAKKRGIEFAEE
tara:strand:+ start:45 stop:305 length:261 start_codon:yes stop_codon:yes gene_type:complete